MKNKLITMLCCALLCILPGCDPRISKENFRKHSPILINAMGFDADMIIVRFPDSDKKSIQVKEFREQSARRIFVTDYSMISARTDMVLITKHAQCDKLIKTYAAYDSYYDDGIALPITKANLEKFIAACKPVHTYMWKDIFDAAGLPASQPNDFFLSIEKDGSLRRMDSPPPHAEAQ